MLTSAAADDLRREARASAGRAFQLRDEAQSAVRAGRAPRPQSLELAAMLDARARLFDRCAESAHVLATRPTRAEEEAAETARADAILDAYLAPWREQKERERLSVRAAWERCEREAPEKMRAWLREGRSGT